MLGSLDLLRLLDGAPKALKLYNAARKAGNGDESALAYLKNEGWQEALDLTVHPGAGEMGRQIVDCVRQAAEEVQNITSGNTIEGEFRVLEHRAPWAGFVKRLIAAPNSGNVIVGPVGLGKTELAKSLAYRWRDRHGYRIEMVNLYGTDKPDYAVSISIRTLRRRMKQLSLVLGKDEVKDPGDDDLEDGDDSDLGPVPAVMPPGGRIVVIDEASLAMTTHYMNKAKRAIVQALTQCRHLRWHVIIIAQMTSLVPKEMFSQTNIWSKHPSGKEISMDRPDIIAVREFWRASMEAFSQVRGLPQWGDCPDIRAWNYVEAPPIGGGAAYAGLCPNRLAPNYDGEVLYPDGNHDVTFP